MMKCHICGTYSEELFSTLVLKKYKATYYRCHSCGFIQTEKPYWLPEAYKNPINICDTGLLSRNVKLSKIASIIIYIYFDRNGKYLDYAGGYGVFTRLMRDIGFDFSWHDPYCQNIFARGFEYHEKEKINLLTVFETFEHFEDPHTEIEKIISLSKNIFFSTELIPLPIPKQGDWWYFAPEHGQHISFYTAESLRHVARENGLNFYTDGKKLHLFTEKKLPYFSFKLLSLSNKFDLAFNTIKKTMRSKTVDDMNSLL